VRSCIPAVLVFLSVVLLAPTALAAWQVGPLAGGHGIAVLPEAGAKEAYAIQVVGTSKPVDSVKPPALPGDLVGRVRDTEKGAYVRDEWDKGALLTDNWSARWSGQLQMPGPGEYTFYLTTDDGARMWVDGEKIIDAWVPRPPTTSEAKLDIQSRSVDVVVEYFEAGGGAVAKLEWSGPGINRQPVPADVMPGGWRAEYFLNTNLQGQPFVTTAPTISDDWGEGGPKVGDEEPGSVCLEWTRIAETLLIVRVHSDPKCSLALFSSQTPGLTGTPCRLIPLGSPDGVTSREGDLGNGCKGSVSCAPTDGSYLFLAVMPADDVMVGMPPLADALKMLHDAATAGMKPNLPPYPKDAEGWITLFNGTDKSGWKLRGGTDFWKVEDGMLRNTEAGSDLYTEWTFADCDLHVEFRIPPGSNSGVYLQGNYEIQVDDCFGQPLRDTMCGAVYHRITPSVNAARKPGEWQTFDVSFTMAGLDDNGRYIWPRFTLVYNETKTIDDKPCEGLTGGAMSSNMLAAGPLMFQGDHGPVDYRNIRIRPK
jgi:3-keto-disaccharide hydrolase/PA14 domain